jgi:adenine-specific DNA methylase
MAQDYRKKLIEVALPLEAINRESAREKSIWHDHPVSSQVSVEEDNGRLRYA